MKKIVILVPDVHGRDFWKDIIPFVDECTKIVFLGDYHDPYPYEGITPSQSLSNFNEIIAFAKQHIDKVTLLLGNHDLSYYNTPEVPNWDVFADRHDWENAATLQALFRDNKDMFNIISMIWLRDVNRRFMFSHAGVHPLWIKDNNLIQNFDEGWSMEVIIGYITNMFLNGDKKLLIALRNIGFTRGGYNDVGSMVWADCHEYMFNKSTPYTQIFGHTQVKEPVIIGENIDIDCHKCFYIDEEGTLRDLKTDEEIY